MGIHVVQVVVDFTPRELTWLYQQAEANGVLLTGLIRKRALNLGSQILDQPPYVPLNENWNEYSLMEGEETYETGIDIHITG